MPEKPNTNDDKQPDPVSAKIDRAPGPLKGEPRQEKVEETELPQPTNKTDVAVKMLEEKLCREYSLSLEDLRKSTITIKNSEVTVKVIERAEKLEGADNE